MLSVFLYSIGIRIYGLALSIAALFHTKASRLQQGRRSWQQKLKQQLAQMQADQKTIWFHVASVGEFEQALPVYQKLNEKHPQHLYVFSFYSPSGYDYAEKKFPEITTCYLPLDTASNMKELIALLRPSMVVIVKYEFWYHLLDQLKRHHIPVFLLSGIFRPSHYFFQPLTQRFFQSMLHNFEHLFVQNEESLQLIQPIVGGSKVSISGDTRAERVLENKSSPLQDRILETFCNQHPVFIAGSVWKEDEAVLQKIIEELPLNYKVILAPHEFTHYSFQARIEEQTHYSDFDSAKRILILDTLGLLSRTYRYASLIYVGGGFGKGIHNILEPLVFGIPVLIGPKHEKFHEAQEMKQLGTVFAINTPEDAAQVTASLLKNDERMTDIRHKLATYFASRANISGEIVVFLEKYLKS